MINKRIVSPIQLSGSKFSTPRIMVQQVNEGYIDIVCVNLPTLLLPSFLFSHSHTRLFIGSYLPPVHAFAMTEEEGGEQVIDTAQNGVDSSSSTPDLEHGDLLEKLETQNR